ncbi:hypothetical protein JW872_02535 [Candidatus Babeliales bacterium]|nr:hypothetical protein [Candidatus Babeliales bacterium]
MIKSYILRLATILFGLQYMGFEGLIYVAWTTGLLFIIALLLFSFIIQSIFLGHEIARSIAKKELFWGTIFIIADYIFLRAGNIFSWLIGSGFIIRWQHEALRAVLGKYQKSAGTLYILACISFIFIVAIKSFIDYIISKKQLTFWELIKTNALALLSVSLFI